jgi:hypothetical protein
LKIAIAFALLPDILYREFGVIPSTYLFGWLTAGALLSAVTIVLSRMVIIYKVQWENRDRS